MEANSERHKQLWVIVLGLYSGPLLFRKHFTFARNIKHQVCLKSRQCEKFVHTKKNVKMQYVTHTLKLSRTI